MASNGHDGPVQMSSPGSDPDEILEYWTEERRANARPVDPPRGDPARGGGATDEIEGSAIAVEADTDASVGPGDAPGPAGPGSALVVGTVPVPNPAAYPHRTVGKLFYQAGGEDVVASAAVVNASGILTAAHCVWSWNTRQWSTNVAFAPAFRCGPDPGYGIWPVGNMFVRNEWIGPPGDVAFDFAFCQIPPRGSTRIGDLTGNLGILVNRPDLQFWDDHGYPGSPIPGYPFDGDRMWNCGGSLTQSVGLTIRKVGNFTPGASGGPWIVQSPEGKFYANGTFSMCFNSPPTESSSPYFRDDVLGLFHTAFG